MKDTFFCENFSVLLGLFELNPPVLQDCCFAKGKKDVLAFPLAPHFANRLFASHGRLEETLVTNGESSTGSQCTTLQNL